MQYMQYFLCGLHLTLLVCAISISFGNISYELINKLNGESCVADQMCVGLILVYWRCLKYFESCLTLTLCCRSIQGIQKKSSDYGWLTAVPNILWSQPSVYFWCECAMCDGELAKLVWKKCAPNGLCYTIQGIQKFRKTEFVCFRNMDITENKTEWISMENGGVEDKQMRELPQKKFYRQRAHANPISDHEFDYPVFPEQ